MTLKNRVHELRSRHQLRQSDLAERIGVTRQTILAIEKGRLNPSVTICLKIARVLQEPVDYVFYLERSEEKPNGNGKKAAPAATESPANNGTPAKPAASDHDEADAGQSIWEFI